MSLSPGYIEGVESNIHARPRPLQLSITSGTWDSREHPHAKTEGYV